MWRRGRLRGIRTALKDPSVNLTQPMKMATGLTYGEVTPRYSSALLSDGCRRSSKIRLRSEGDRPALTL
jgi:hypothetical protein